MFRAIRFAAQLGFELTGETVAAIRSCAGGSERIAAERVRVEVEKTLCSKHPECATQFFSFGLMDRWTKGGPANLVGLSSLPAEPLLRWAGLCARLMEGACIAHVELFLRALKLDGATIRACETGWSLRQEGVPEDDTGWRKALARYEVDACCAGAAMVGVQALHQLESVLAHTPCVRVEQLALSGGALFDMGLRGEQIGRAQRCLLEHVLACPEDNRAGILRLKLKEFSSCF